MIKIIPAILPISYRAIEAGVEKVHDAVDTVQIDFVDGTLANNRTWIFNNRDQEKVSAILREEEGLPYWDSMNYEFDLIVAHPLEHMDTFVMLGPSKIIFHIESFLEKEQSEALLHYFETLPEIVRTTITFGMALGLDTDPALIIPYTDHIDTIQCMGIAKIGFQGQLIDERVFTQIEKVKQIFPEKKISVDGGVTLITAPSLVQAGATVLIVGSGVFQSVDPHGTIQILENI